jgi:hypothetical protein
MPSSSPFVWHPFPLNAPDFISQHILCHSLLRFFSFYLGFATKAEVCLTPLNSRYLGVLLCKESFRTNQTVHSDIMFPDYSVSHPCNRIGVAPKRPEPTGLLDLIECFPHPTISFRRAGSRNIRPTPTKTAATSHLKSAIPRHSRVSHPRGVLVSLSRLTRC